MYASDFFDDEDRKVLLVGEANFSFCISLCKYVSPRRITATSYETREQLERIHGRDLIESNLADLARLNVESIRFGIDATRLADVFPTSRRFARVYFMFPHVSGRSNLRKNRQLMSEFFASCRQVLEESDGAVFVALAAGQGGTSFEFDASRRGNKDSWQINQLAQQHGLILTSCDLFEADKFEYYKSTGFRSQSKSFCVERGLVHKFELSLPSIEANSCSYVDQIRRFDRFLHRQSPRHPLRQLTDFLANYLSPNPNIIIDDKHEFMLDNLYVKLVIF